jgi:hypothetical protein
MVARYAMHTHLAWDICEEPLEKKMALLRASGYQGCWASSSTPPSTNTPK